MKKHRLRLSGLAVRDLDSVLEWGIDYWGAAEAVEWVDELESHFSKRLSESPAGYSLAPESEEFGFEIRQLIYGRYRVLFTIIEDEVLVLRVRGPYTSRVD